MSAGNAWAVIVLGIASTTQTHMAKSLERQGIETLDLIRDRLRRSDTAIEGRTRKPLIYGLGLALNYTTFIYHLFVTPLGGTTALYTSMYGIGLVVLLPYATLIMKERISRLELSGAVVILLGTLIIGIEGISRPALDMGQMDLGWTVAAVAVLLGFGLALILVGLRDGRPNAIGLAFGLGAGICGSLDPFLKGVGQSAGGGAFTPGSAGGWVVLASSFLIGWLSWWITQWGFYRRARANVLVPAFNCTYIAVPVALQALLLPGYGLTWATWLGLGLIMTGFGCMRGFGRGYGEEVGQGGAEGSGDPV